MNHTILICDDEPDIVNALHIYLAPEGYRLLHAANGREAVDLVKTETIHLILLDVMMPQMDGITATTYIRELSNAPIILLTAKSETQDKVLGLNVGADDYITKPFDPLEVLARVRSQLRRYATLGTQKAVPSSTVQLGGLTLDDLSRTFAVDGEAVYLTPIEYEIMKLFMAHPGKVFSSREIYQAVWKETPFGSENAVAVHIRHLREKIEINPSEPRYLTVVWGHGYKLTGGSA